MDKTMTRFLAILAALTCAASAQTYRTVTADTNNAIRTNFTLGAAQISGSFAISNVTGLQSALDGKLATNGSAAGLTNFPALLLATNSSESVFPSALLRTNGDGSGLTNLPNANLSNATGVLPLANGGTGQTNAALAIEALLPAYTGNSNRILALNSNATSLIWTTNGGGGGGITYTNAEEALNGLGFASSNNNSINLFNNGGTNADSQHTVIGSGASAFGTANVMEAVVIGALAEVTNGGVAVGSYAVTDNGVAVGPNAKAEGSSVAFGRFADARGGTATNNTNVGSVALGTFATVLGFEGIAIGSSSQSESRGVAIGASSLVETNANTGPIGGTAVGYDSAVYGGGVAIGDNALTDDGVAIGYSASAAGESIAIGAEAYNGGFATNAIQIGRGTNTNNNTIQFYNAGIVSTNEWKALADSTMFGHLFMSAPTNGSNGQVAALNSNASALVWTNITASYPSFSNNAAKVLAVSTNETGVEWIAVSNTVTDASTLTNFPASILQTNSADGSFPALLLRTNGSAAGLTSFPTLNQNTTGTASNVTGVVAIANGGSGQTTAAAAIEAFLPAYSGNANRILALNSNATALSWVTNAGGASTVDLASTNATGILPLTKGGTGTNSASGAMAAFGVYAANNQVILGASASDGTSGGFSPIQQVIVGAEAYSRSSYSVTVGYRSTNLGANNTIINARSTTNASDATAIGGRPFTSNAVVDAAGAVQIGIGTNSTANSIQFRTNGSVSGTAWGYLASASTKGGSRMTNTNGVTVTNTIIGYDGTNYTTNTIAVIDGIITSWTQ